MIGGGVDCQVRGGSYMGWAGLTMVVGEGAGLMTRLVLCVY